jgi:glycine cleavage system aminomethyltransferase T
MSADNLEQMIRQADGDVVGMLRNAPVGNFAFPYQPEYTNWRDEQEAWATTAILFDQSTHMTDVYFKGPDVKRLFSETAVNNFEKFGRNKAKQFVGVNEDGLVVGDGILFGLEDDEYSLVGTGIAANWVAYRAQTGGYDVDVTFDLASVINPNPRKIFRFQIQGPNALKVVERACDGELPAIKFFNMGEFTIADVPIRALNHTMVGQPGLEHTGLEMIGPLDRGSAVWAALVEAGADFGLKQGGGLAYPTTALETGWIPFPVPAIYTGDAMKAYREHLGPDTLEANYALAGSQVLAKVEDYYVTPWDIGYGRLIHLDHDFIGRDALKARAEQPHAQKVWLRWNIEDCARVLADSLFKKPGQGRTKYLTQPFSDYAVSQNDRVLAGGTDVGRSTYSSYTVNVGGFASIGVIDQDHARDGQELTVIWGEPDGGTSKPGVERHVQAEIRATVSTTPLT